MQKLFERMWIAVVLLTAGAMLGVMSYLRSPPVAAAPIAELPAGCVEWGKAGAFTIWRCEDEDTNEMCMHSDSGMMNCRLE